MGSGKRLVKMTWDMRGKTKTEGCGSKTHITIYANKIFHYHPICWYHP